jgi:hypothetical protein
MSFLYDRLVSHIDSATRNPQAEEEAKVKQNKFKELNKKTQTFIDNQKKLLFDKTPKKISDEIVIAHEDIQLLKGILDELDKANKTITDYDTLNTKSEEITERYNSLAKNSFKSGSQWIPGARGVRLDFYILINSIRQALQDYPDIPYEYNSTGKEVIKSLKNTLETNLYTNDNAYEEAKYNLREKYSTIIQKIQNGIGGDGKDEWDSKTGIMLKCINGTKEKYYNKNNLRIDFKELPTDPDLLTDVVKSKAEYDAVQIDKEMDNFSIGNVFKTAISIGLRIGLILLIIFLALMGGSIAVNLNVYKPWPYRIFYAIYGMIFSPIVLFYRLVYRGWWLGKRPVYYGFFPIIPYFFVNKYTRFFLSWLTYKPDEHVWDLQEWRH